MVVVNADYSTFTVLPESFNYQLKVEGGIMGKESVPIQLAQCWFLGLAISNAKI